MFQKECLGQPFEIDLSTFRHCPGGRQYLQQFQNLKLGKFRPLRPSDKFCYSQNYPVTDQVQQVPIFYRRMLFKFMLGDVENCEYIGKYCNKENRRISGNELEKIKQGN